jgi:hypothetical protein
MIVDEQVMYQGQSAITEAIHEQQEPLATTKQAEFVPHPV